MKNMKYKNSIIKQEWHYEDMFNWGE